MESNGNAVAAAMGQHTNMEIVSVPVADLIPDRKNARRGDVAVIVESLREFGQHRPAVVRREDNTIIIGNHMWKAARTLGWSHLDVVFVDDDEEKALRRGLADNATGDKATWEDELLAEHLQRTGELPGFSQSDIDALLKKVSADIDGEKVEPTYPIVARPNEEYDYVLIVAKNATDCAYLRTKFDLRKERSYKSSSVGLSHVVSVERLQELWGS